MGIGGYMVGALVAAGMLGFFLLMIFFPEWVGITSKNERRRMADEAKANGQPPHADDEVPRPK
jgi:hypothetical protein